jgi:hypothetical protein
MKAREVQPLPGYKIRVRYEDGVEGEVDLSRYVGKGVFVAWDDVDFFNSVHISAHGSIAWSDDLELCPDSIYLELTGKTPEELFRSVPVSQS